MARLALAVLACCALAADVTACGRSELPVPDDAGSSGDDASGDEDAIVISDAPVAVGDDASLDAPLEVEASEEDALFFAGPPLVDGGSTVASDGGGCGPSTCGGCCEGEYCRIGTSVLACGAGGQGCVSCGPELSCPHGTCQ